MTAQNQRDFSVGVEFQLEPVQPYQMTSQHRKKTLGTDSVFPTLFALAF